MNHSKITIAIKGGYGGGNFGDDALMVAAFEIVKRVFTSESIIFFCYDASYIHRILPGARVISPDSKYWKVADMVLYGGGTQFFSFPLTGVRSPLSFFGRVMRDARRPIRLGQKMLRKAMELSYFASNRRMAAIGIGLGPFVENCSNMRSTKKLIARMDYVAVRDIHSYDLCKEWGCNNVLLRSDLCYLPDLWKAYVPDSKMEATGDIKRVGVIIRDWPHTYEGDSYVAPLFQVVDELRSAGKEVKFISFADRYDSEWAKRLDARHERLIAWNPEQDSISSFLELLSGYDAFITARYHGAVFASILGKPMVCIEVEQKLNLVADLVSDGAQLWTYPFHAFECLKHISYLEGNYSKSIACLARVVEEQGALAKKMVDEFRLVIADDPKTGL